MWVLLLFLGLVLLLSCLLLHAWFHTTCCTGVCAFNAAPSVQLPKMMELIGLGYTSWFIYRYLLFKVRQAAQLLALQHRVTQQLNTALGHGRLSWCVSQRAGVSSRWCSCVG